MRRSLPLLCLSALLALPALPVAGTELTPEQLQAAARVFLGHADCDLQERVHLAAIDDRPGHFALTHRKASYTLSPVVTSTGAIRLEDRQAGVVWLQIPAKSMLLNAKAGKREVDGCRHAEQVAGTANTLPADSIGIAPAEPAVAPSAALTTAEGASKTR